MPGTLNPNATAEDFAVKYLGRKPTSQELAVGSKMNSGNCDGCWRAQTKDGSWVIYRPAGKAGKDTLPTTATVEIKNQTISQFNAGTKQLKLKFPLK
mgnify:CR=1 FL=1